MRKTEMAGHEGLDTSAVARLDQLRATYDRLWTERVRAEGDVERLERELDQAREAARAQFGTDDEAALAALIRAAEVENARLLDEFEAVLSDIDARLGRLGAERGL